MNVISPRIVQVLIHFIQKGKHMLVPFNCKNGCVDTVPAFENDAEMQQITYTHSPKRLDIHTLTFHTGGSGSCGASNLTWETGTLDGLRALFYLILIAAAMDGHHLTGTLLHLI